MKRHGILNTHISQVLSTMGHTDTITIADCGLPIFDEGQRIDLAIKVGKPSFIEVLNAVKDDMAIERIVLADEIKNHNPEVEAAILAMLPNVEVVYVSHEEFKVQTQESKAVIRTGEATPYANIILQSGVIF